MFVLFPGFRCYGCFCCCCCCRCCRGCCCSSRPSSCCVFVVAVVAVAVVVAVSLLSFSVFPVALFSHSFPRVASSLVCWRRCVVLACLRCFRPSCRRLFMRCCVFTHTPSYVAVVLHVCVLVATLASWRPGGSCCGVAVVPCVGVCVFVGRVLCLCCLFQRLFRCFCRGLMNVGAQCAGCCSGELMLLRAAACLLSVVICCAVFFKLKF